MTASELIKLLKKLPGDTRVVVSGYEGGVNDVSEVEEVNVILDHNTSWYYGQHSRTERGGVKAVQLIGYNNLGGE